MAPVLLFFNTTKNMKQRLQEVRIEDFDIAALRRAAREGRLYIVPAAECETGVEQEVLAYVSRIAEYAAPPYRGCIDEVWRRIVKHTELALLPKTRKEPFCKYRVTVIAIYLRNKGVYALDTDTRMHQLLEGLERNKRNHYYTCKAQYALTRQEASLLSSIIKAFGEEK